MTKAYRSLLLSYATELTGLGLGLGLGLALSGLGLGLGLTVFWSD